MVDMLDARQGRPHGRVWNRTVIEGRAKGATALAHLDPDGEPDSQLTGESACPDDAT